MVQLIATIAALILRAAILYPADAVVVESQGDTVALETTAGEIYEMVDGGWSTGDEAILLMDSAGTADPTDDSIVVAVWKN